MPESMVSVGDAELCVDTVGRAGDPAVLLISGATSSMDWWEPEFCERIAAAGRFVIRYDHRDTGQSTTSAVGEPAYTGPCPPSGVHRYILRLYALRSPLPLKASADLVAFKAALKGRTLGTARLVVRRAQRTVCPEG